MLKIILSLAIALISWPILNLLKHYIKGRSVGLPIIIKPIDLLNPIWILTHKPLVPLFESLPFGLGDSLVYTVCERVPQQTWTRLSLGDSKRDYPFG
jgi:hypothetical protein